MHATRRAARQLAWQDSQNPFGKFHTRARPRVDLETGNGSNLYRVEAHTRQDHGPSDSKSSEDDTKSSSTVSLPIVTSQAVSMTRHDTDPSQHSARITNDKSSPSIVNSQDTISEQEPCEDGQHDLEKHARHRKLRGWFRGKSKGKSIEDESDDDNGKSKKRLTIASQFVAILEGGTFIYAWKYTPWLSLLYLAIPTGFVVNYTHQSPTVNFAVNLIAILPSAALLSLAVEELGLRIGDIFGGLLNASFSNAAQLISSILLLKSRQLILLQSSLLGAILSNLLFMTGLGFLFGGIGRIEQSFNKTLAQTLCCLLMLAVLSLIIPSAAHYLADMTEPEIIMQSRGISVVILISYVLWLFFQLYTHKSEFYKELQPPPKVDTKQSARMKALVPARMRRKTPEIEYSSDLEDEVSSEESEEPKLTLWVAIGATVVSLVLLWFNTEFATNSVQGMLQQAGVSQTFAGVAILPLLSNDWNMPLLARQNKMQMLLTLTLEKSMQTALAIIPIIVLIGWGIGVDMTLEFNGFVIAASFAAMVMVSYVVQEGKSNWLVGALLVKVYIIISIAAYFIRD